MKKVIKLFLWWLGLCLGMGGFFAYTLHRFDNPNLTETQLVINSWDLAVMIFVGYILFFIAEQIEEK